jgi:outer membrane translocation and assembly module TamA
MIKAQGGSSPICLFKTCKEVALQVFCKDHLENPPCDNIKLSENVTICPTTFKKPKGLDKESEMKNLMGSTFHLTSPLMLKKSRCVKLKLQKKLHQSFAHNLKHLVVSELEPTSYEGGNFYAPDSKMALREAEIDPQNNWKSSENFQTVKQTEKHQLFICSRTKEEGHENLSKTLNFQF